MKMKGQLASGREWKVEDGCVLFREYIDDDPYARGEWWEHVRGGVKFRTDSDEEDGTISRLERGETAELDGILDELAALKARVVEEMGKKRNWCRDILITVAEAPRGRPKATVVKCIKAVGDGNGRVRVAYAIDTGRSTVMRDERIHTEWKDYIATDEELWEIEVAPYLAVVAEGLGLNDA